MPAKMFLSKDGDWYHEDEKITHPGILEKLNRSLKWEDDGYYVTIGYERCKVQIEDAPYLVKGVREKGESLVLELSDFTEEVLEPSTIKIGDKNIPYARVKKSRDWARFTRPAYYQLTRHLVEKRDGSPALQIGGKTYPLPAGENR